MQFGPGSQYSLVTFYNPDLATMASFIALAHVEQNVRARERLVCGLDTQSEKRCSGVSAGVLGAQIKQSELAGCRRSC